MTTPGRCVFQPGNKPYQSDADITGYRTFGGADVKSVRQNPVHDNGAGFAPFFMALCLWIGGIAIFLISPALDLGRHPEESFWRCGFRSMAIGALFGALQAVTVVTGLQLFLKLDAQNFGALILIAVLASIGYVAVNQACVAALGYRGRALSVILLCLQITSTGATFPVETAPKFFQFLSPLLPMTHVAHTIRAAIAGGELHLGKALVVLAIWTLLSWVATLIAAARRKGQRPMPYDPALTFKKVPSVSSPLGQTLPITLRTLTKAPAKPKKTCLADCAGERRY